MRGSVRRALVVATAVAAASLSSAARQPGPLSVREAVEWYARGDFATAVDALDTRRLTVLPFTRALDTWIAEGDPASAARRRLVAAAFALDAVWAKTRTFDNARQANADPSNRVPPVS